MKNVSALSGCALAVMLGLSGATLGASTADAQGRARVTVYGPGSGYSYGTQEYYEARMAMCQEGRGCLVHRISNLPPGPIPAYRKSSAGAQ